jgi:hypothetical protein
VENRFVRLCNNFDDLTALLSFGALGLYPTPSFCKSASSSFNPGLSRGHLSLCGVVVTDMISTAAPDMPNPCPTTKKAKQRGYTVWAELETRAYIFGAIRNEEDEFTRAFLRELRARPDFFQVVTRSETDPGQVPNRDYGHLVQNVAWAALCARGYGEGEYTLRKYARASDKLFQDCAGQRLGWMPKGSWSATRMEDFL